MTPKTILDTLDVLLRLVRRVERGDMRAVRKLKDILPQRTYTRLVREVEAVKDRAKFGR